MTTDSGTSLPRRTERPCLSSTIRGVLGWNRRRRVGLCTLGGVAMKLLRGLAASLLWILAGVLGLVGGLLSVTIILLPLGLPLLWLARKLGGTAGRLMLPKVVKHPVQELRDKSSSAVADGGKGARRFFGKTSKAVAESAPTTRKGRKKAQKAISSATGKKKRRFL